MKIEGPIGCSSACFIPDPNHSYNFMLDTTAFNRFARDSDALSIAISAKEVLHYVYFKTQVQDREILGKDLYGKAKDKTNWRDVQQKILQVELDLGVIRVPHVANLMYNGWPLDGTCPILEDNGDLPDLNNSIRRVCNSNPKGNPRHMEDSVIADAAIRHNCILITSDSRDIIKKMLPKFPNNVISFSDFITVTINRLRDQGD